MPSLMSLFAALLNLPQFWDKLQYLPFILLETLCLYIVLNILFTVSRGKSFRSYNIVILFAISQNFIWLNEKERWGKPDDRQEMP
jgi:hypothetical protein